MNANIKNTKSNINSSFNININLNINSNISIKTNIIIKSISGYCSSNQSHISQVLATAHDLKYS